MATVNMPKEVKHNLAEVELGNKTAHVKVEEFKGKDYLSIRFVWEPEPGVTRYTQHGVNIPLWESKIALEAMIEALNEATGSDLMLINRSELDE